MLGVFSYVGFSYCLHVLFFLTVSLSVTYFCTHYATSLGLSHLLNLLTMASSIAMLSNAQLGALSCLKHGKAGLRSYCE